MKKKEIDFNIHLRGGNIVFYSPDLKKDAFDLQKLLNIPNLKIIYHPARGDYLSNRVSLVHNKTPIVLMVEEQYN